MEFIGEIFIEVIGGIAEIIGWTIAEETSEKMTDKRTAANIAVSVLAGIVTWIVIIALGFFTYWLFAAKHVVFGIITALTLFFLLVVFLSVVFKMRKIKKDKVKEKKK